MRKWGILSFIAGFILLSGAVYIVLDRNRAEAPEVMLPFITPSSTDEVSIADGAVLGSLLPENEWSITNHTFFAYDDEGGIMQAGPDRAVRVDGEGAFLEDFGPLIGLAVDLEGDIYSAMSIASTVCKAVGVDGPSAPPLVRTNSSRAVVMEIDGLGHEMLIEAAMAGSIPNITEALEVGPLLTAYPPITNVGTAMALTGEPPAMNGIRAREDLLLNALTFLERASAEGLSTLWIEGDRSFLDAEVRTNVDGDGDGLVDDEIHEDLIAGIKDGTDLVMAHYHSLDDISHEFGPYSVQFNDSLDRMDAWLGEVQRVIELAPGPTLLVVFSDHGMHQGPDGKGEHGDLRHEDMFGFTAWKVFGAEGEGRKAILTISPPSPPSIDLTMEDLLKVPAFEGSYAVKGSKGNETNLYRGWSMEGILESAGLQADWSVLNLSAQDGYMMSITSEWAFSEGGVMVAYSRDGRPLPEDEGPLRLIVSQQVAGEWNGQYCLKGLRYIELG